MFLHWYIYMAGIVRVINTVIHLGILHKSQSYSKLYKHILIFNNNLSLFLVFKSNLIFSIIEIVEKYIRYQFNINIHLQRIMVKLRFITFLQNIFILRLCVGLKLIYGYIFLYTARAMMHFQSCPIDHLSRTLSYITID